MRAEREKQASAQQSLQDGWGTCIFSCSGLGGWGTHKAHKNASEALPGNAPRVVHPSKGCRSRVPLTLVGAQFAVFGSRWRRQGVRAGGRATHGREALHSPMESCNNLAPCHTLFPIRGATNMADRTHSAKSAT